ncbi:MAG: rhomboid family intramembrane serine protease [Steroidobacteraceae bacterium]
MNGIGLGAALIALATLAFSLGGLYGSPRLIERCVFRPYLFARGRALHTAITSGLVHADLPHLIFNGVTFWFFAVPLERIIGTLSFVALYVFGLLFSLVGSLLKHRDDPQYGTLGASGAISAALFAAIVYVPTQSLILFPIPIPIPAPLYAIGYLGYSWWSARQHRGDRINHDAHFAGAVWGLVFVALTDPGAYPEALGAISTAMAR